MLEGADPVGGERAPGDAVEAVAARHVVAGEGLLAALVTETDDGRGGVRLLDRQRLGLEQQRRTARLRQLKRDEILDDLGLGVDHHRLAAGGGGEVHAVAAALEAQLDALVGQSLAVQALAGAALPQHIHGALLQDPGPLAPLGIRPVPALQHHAVDPGAVQQTGEQQPGGPAADDADGRAHHIVPSLWWSKRPATCSLSETSFIIDW
ncbi:hypothetical protein SSPO_030480 [Streptomyces antimycoticus]|uniref:Uncharacterized protein n=1 Tax=Streptomyces antimycoticus TaxID=68175 RepID=A0A499UJ56_9ACTN|nr:hypothetical protein SSPO_030480 [Streptomyces antimycoticus]